jgi:hypothetical protein
MRYLRLFYHSDEIISFQNGTNRFYFERILVDVFRIGDRPHISDVLHINNAIIVFTCIVIKENMKSILVLAIDKEKLPT